MLAASDYFYGRLLPVAPGRSHPIADGRRSLSSACATLHGCGKAGFFSSDTNKESALLPPSSGIDYAKG